MKLFGLLNCDKPSGMTSRDVVNVVQRRLKKTKVGHAGTLDPIAEGVLVLGVGPASRLVPYVQQSPKRYLGDFQLGLSSPSGDIETETSPVAPDVRPTREALESASSNLVGTIEQIPPAYSAVHVDGKRAYQRARAGESFEMPKRRVEVYELNIVNYDFPRMTLDIACGSGTYVRTLGMDLAGLVGTAAVMTALQRTSIGPFERKDSVSIDNLREDDLARHLQPASMAVEGLPKVTVDEHACTRLKHGLEINIEAQPPTGDSLQGLLDEGLEAAAISPEGDLKAIVYRKRDAWYPRRVFLVD